MKVPVGSSSSGSPEIVVFFENFSEAASLFQTYRNRVEDTRSTFVSHAAHHDQDMGSGKLAEQYNQGVQNAVQALDNLAQALDAYANVFGKISQIYQKLDQTAFGAK